MTEAIRSPGSALKPFIYALAFENGIAHPETLLDDRPRHYGIYAPENFDHSFQGTVTARRALQLSLNLPAVELLDEIGPALFHRAFAQCRRADRAAGRNRSGTSRRSGRARESRCAISRRSMLDSRAEEPCLD